MAPSAIYDELPFNSGEREMHELLHVPDRDNPTSLYLPPYAANILFRSPLLALGTLDAEGRPWTSLWGGERGFSRQIAEDIIAAKASVDRYFDPVLERLFGEAAKEGNGDVVRPENVMMSGLGIDLEHRSRVKLYGKMIGGAVSATEDKVGEVQLAVHIEQSLGNCPKYLNKKRIVPAIPRPQLLSDTLPLPPEATALLAKADLFFISSSDHNSDMDTNHRGGPPGFVRVTSNAEHQCVIVYPEYSGNRLYQTLGNLRTTPKAGLVFPDFETGDVLYVTGTTEVLIGEQASDLLPHTNLAVKITIDAARFVKEGLALRGVSGELSPYNPPVRLLKSEQKNALPSISSSRMAVLTSKQILGPTIARYKFHIQDLSPNDRGVMTWKPGQYVALSFEEELNIGYSHMRDDDPTSLNDDYLRTFTVSALPSNESTDEFEVTLRTNGPVTSHLYRLNPKAHLEIPVLGFGGEFFIKVTPEENTAFVAGGVGITPLLAQASQLDLSKLELIWAVRNDDLEFVRDTIGRIPGLGSKRTRVFVTGSAKKEDIEGIEETGVIITQRRLEKTDFENSSNKVYLCASTGLRKKVLEWMEGKDVVYEDFGY